MEIATAQAAGKLSAQIAALQTVLTQIQTMIAEGWTVTRMEATAPVTGSETPAGTIVSLLPFGAANAANSTLALNTALQTYQAQLDALTAQLAAL